MGVYDMVTGIGANEVIIATGASDWKIFLPISTPAAPSWIAR
jgi:hypothetical protein